MKEILLRMPPALSYASMSVKPSETDIQRLRKEKDAFFQASPHSPIPIAERAAFQGLRYFPFDPDLAFEVELQELEDPEEVVMATSVSGEEALYHKVGFFEFEVDGAPLRLYAYRSAHEHEVGRPSLFVPFRDATSGKATYGAGRYLDLAVSPSGRYVLDFNQAYNPYCAYSEMYVCPLPPGENWLKAEVRAGEQDYPGGG